MTEELSPEMRGFFNGVRVMFTGIINHLGRFAGQTKGKFIFEIPSDLLNQLNIGSSIAIDGVCLTVRKKDDIKIYVDVMPETLKKTILGKLRPKSLVNLELPVTAKTLLAGHIVQGHIDGISQLKKITKKGNSRILKFSIPQTINKYVVEKGSIAVNGISLTVIEVGKDQFSVGIIPFTWNESMFNTIRTGDFVNIEVDILAKYLERLIKND